MWIRFRLNGHDLEWSVEPGPPRHLLVRSPDGRYSVRALVRDHVFAKIKGVVDVSVISPPLVLGPEFPPGCAVPDVPFELEGGFEMAPYGILHTELVRSLVERWAHRRRYRRRA